MRKLKFTLKNGNSVSHQEFCNYSTNDNFYSFKTEDFNICFKADENSFYFIEKTSSHNFEIKFYNSTTISTIYIKEHKLELPLKVRLVEYKYNDKELLFSYIIESEKDIVKSIIISFIN